MEKRIEYGAFYPFALDDPPNEYYGPVARSQAESLVRTVNTRLKAQGRPQSAMLVEREVTVGDWRPANTGIVPPFITEAVENADAG